ncbi:msbA [Symbiodinium sp. CCMP2592]|nr:msbA [Symbiodinium sp. CCMP2592]
MQWVSSIWSSGANTKPYRPLLPGPGPSETEPSAERASEAEAERRRVALNWLLQGNEDDVRKVLIDLAERKAWLLQQALDAATDCSSTLGSPRSPRRYRRRSYGSQLMQRTLQLAAATPVPTVPAKAPTFKSMRTTRTDMTHPWEDCIVQFSSPVYLVEEDDGEVVLDIVRVGPTDEPCQVSYATRDCSAKADLSFKATAGTVYYEPGEFSKSIAVPLISNTRWDTHVEFAVQLLEDGLVGGVLGHYLHETRVKIIDDDTFPSTRFKDQVLAQDFDSIPRLGLLWEYISRNLGEPLVQQGTRKMLLLAVLDSLFLMFKLLLNLYILQFVLSQNFPEEELLIVQDRVRFLYYSMACLLLWFGIQHYLHYLQPSWRVAGLTRAVLQTGLLSSFLNYDEESRNTVDTGQIGMAMIHDVPNLVNNGFLGLVALLSAVFKLMVMLAFQIVVPPMLGKSPTWLGLGPALCIPLITCFFLYVRFNGQTKVLRDSEDKEAGMVGYITESVRTFRLIADFGQSTTVLDQFHERLVAYNKSAVACAQMEVNNQQFVAWMTTFLVAVYTVFGGISVMDGRLEFGMFVTNIGVFNTAGAAGTELCQVLLAMQRVAPSLDRMVRFLNLPTDLLHRRDLERHRRLATAQFVKEKTDEDTEEDPGFVVDRLNLAIHNLQFSYPGNEPVSFDGRLEFAQGKLLAIIGARHSGKSTLLRILAGRNLPQLNNTAALFFVPAHLQVLYVPHMILFFRGSLYSNLVYGARHSEDASMQRVLNICESLHLGPKILEEIQSQADIRERDWAQKLSATQCQALSLARAFVANAELMCLERPTEQFHDEDVKRICKLLRQHVKHRGLETDEESLHRRRPRTCIFTTMRMMCVKAADTTYLVKHDGVQQMPSNQVTEQMLR